MVNHDLPSFRELAEVQREHARRIVLLPLKMIFANDHRCPRTILLYFDIRERQPAHRFAIGIRPMVAVEHRLPAPRYAIRPDKQCLLRPPVVLHKRVDIAAIPGSLLRFEHGANLRLVGRTGRYRAARPAVTRDARTGGPRHTRFSACRHISAHTQRENEPSNCGSDSKQLRPARHRVLLNGASDSAHVCIAPARFAQDRWCANLVRWFYCSRRPKTRTYPWCNMLIAALIFVISLATALQFIVLSWRAAVLKVASEPLSAEWAPVAGPLAKSFVSEGFSGLAAYSELCPNLESGA